MGQKKDDAYKDMIQHLSNKKPLTQIQNELLFTRKEIEQGNRIPASKSKIDSSYRCNAHS